MINRNSFDFFPSKLAMGKSFCNRINEQCHLINNIYKIRHTIIYSPRRYGKSSLVNKVIVDLDLPYAVIDLFLAYDEIIIVKRIMTGISNIISKILSPSEKMFNKVRGYFRNFKVSLGTKGFCIENLSNCNNYNTVDQINDALRTLNIIASEKSCVVIIFFDEFADIINAENSKSIQGVIRNIAQNTNNIVFIFSGSYQHMLTELFDDKLKPLYMLCDKMYLERIPAIEYKKHINNLALVKWQKTINTEVLNRILVLSESHAFYVNMLCNILFENNNIPTLNDVNNAWSICQEIEYRRIISDIQSLSSNQLKILRLIAASKYANSFNKYSSEILSKNISVIKQCINDLLKKDFIYKVSVKDPDLSFIKIGQYRVSDPLISTILKKLLPDGD